VELQRSLEKIRAQGLGVAAISYDSPAVLKEFAERRGITFPLLSDEASSTIRAFGILNEDVPAGTPFAGVPHPGTYIVDRAGRVVSKFFEDDYTERYTASDILVRQFGSAAGAAHSTTETRHLLVSAAASTDRIRAGQRIALTLDIEMKPRMHVYAPEVQGYLPIQWSMQASPASTAHPVAFPASKKLHLPAIDETVSVYEGRIRLVRDITIGKVPPGSIVVEGELKYQACDDKQCFMPQTVPLKWSLQVEPHDSQRTRPELQRKPNKVR
jgi:hypothetical protein